jgi:hypothetical protein
VIVRVARAGFAIVAGLVVVLLTGWNAGVLYYSTSGGSRGTAILAVAFVVIVAAAFIFVPGRLRTLGAFLVVFAGILLWWLSWPATNQRPWQPEVAQEPWATQDGDIVTVHNIRNFDYKTETDFVPRWDTRRYDLRELETGDLIAVYWAGRAIAHIMVSFGFAGRDYLAMSIETRKQRGEGYSTVAGFFKQYELVYIAGDERDLIGVRTTYRQPQEDVYVYRLKTSRENLRRVFLDYIQTMNDMKEHPVFYNTLTTNCTTGVAMHAKVNPNAPPWSWKILLPGYVPQYVYELGRMDTSVPFAELEKRAWVNERAHAAGKAADFSQRIRAAAKP